MVIILTDSTYNIIVSYMEVTNSESLVGIPMSIQLKSYIDGKLAKTFHVKDENIPEEIRDRLVESHDDYIYTEEDGFKKRPKITIINTDDKQLMKISQDGVYMFPIGEDIELVVRYEDPDGVGFIEKFDRIKVKDRNDFISVDPFIDIVENKTEYKLKVKSDFPGVAEVRAKDVNYLCVFNPFLMRFKQR